MNAAYSLQMPNTYVSLPGFDVDSTELTNKKLKETEAQLPRKPNQSETGRIAVNSHVAIWLGLRRMF